VAAAADCVSRPSGHEQYQSDDEEDDPQDQDEMGEGEGRDEARENEPEHDKDDSEAIMTFASFLSGCFAGGLSDQCLNASFSLSRRWFGVVAGIRASFGARAGCESGGPTSGKLCRTQRVKVENVGRERMLIESGGRTAKLFPDRLKVSAITTLHLLGIPGHRS
jgi:hypothetical protein